jgi:hypothetical protein
VEADEEVGADRHKPAQRVSMGGNLTLHRSVYEAWIKTVETNACEDYWYWRGASTLASSRATASPYICLTECCTAIRLLRDAFVARLEGSFESSAR